MAEPVSEVVKSQDDGTKPVSNIESGGDTQRPFTPIAGSSDGEDERSARERLKKTSIAGLAQQSRDLVQNPAESASSHSPATDAMVETNNGSRGRPAKKRSFEDLARDDNGAEAETAVGQPPSPKSGHHKRMRSRDVASSEQPSYGTLNNIAGTVHEESDIEAHKSPGGPGVLVDAPSKEEMDAEAEVVENAESSRPASQTAISEGHKSDDVSQHVANSTNALSGFSNVSKTSGFANASAASPFGSARPTSPTKFAADEHKSTSNSAFASSGLSAFASSEKSPFGAAGSSKGGFGGTSSGFGSASGGGFGSGSGFGSKTSGFGGSIPGFGSTSGGFGGGSSSFGAPKPFGTASAFGSGSGFGSSKPGGFGTGKPFESSTKNEEDEGSGNEDEAANEETSVDNQAQQDPRFHEQHIDTGEEGEQTYFTCRAKLYHFEKEWKEKGVGTLKLNIRLAEERAEITSTETKALDSQSTTHDDEDPESGLVNFSVQRKGRLVMRADGVHRVILNTPIFKGMRFGASDGSAPTGKTMHLQGLEDGKPRGYQIKIGKEEVLKDLYNKLCELEKQAV